MDRREPLEKRYPFAVANTAANLTARDTVWRTLLSIPSGYAGWVECRGFDVFAEVRLVRRFQGANGDPVESTDRARPHRIGPAGSAYPFRVDDGGEVQYRVLCPLGQSGHVSPTSGVYAGQGTRDARVTARFMETEPDYTLEEQTISFITGYGDQDAVAASSDGSRIFPTGYNRRYIVRSASEPLGTLDIRTGHAGGLNGSSFDSLTGSVPLEREMTGRVDPWQSIVLSNDDSTATLVGTVQLVAPERA